MSIKQLSVFLENKPGKLSEMTACLAANQIDLRALSLAETNGFGIARVIVDDVEKAEAILQKGGFVTKTSNVLAFAIPDETGGLNRLLSVFNEAKVNIIYMYAFLGGREKRRAYMIFRVTDTAASEAALTARGLTPLSQAEIAEI